LQHTFDFIIVAHVTLKTSRYRLFLTRSEAVFLVYQVSRCNGYFSTQLHKILSHPFPNPLPPPVTTITFLLMRRHVTFCLYNSYRIFFFFNCKYSKKNTIHIINNCCDYILRFSLLPLKLSCLFAKQNRIKCRSLSA
jgi:hypothetical protein